MRGRSRVVLGRFVMIHTMLWTLQTHPLYHDVVNAEGGEFASSCVWLLFGAEAKCHPERLCWW